MVDSVRTQVLTPASPTNMHCRPVSHAGAGASSEHDAPSATTCRTQVAPTHESPPRQGHGIPASPSGVHTPLQKVPVGHSSPGPQAAPTSTIRRHLFEEQERPRRQRDDGSHASPSLRPKLHRRSPRSATSHFAPDAQSPSTRQVTSGAGGTSWQRSATQRRPAAQAGLPVREHTSPTPPGAQPAPVRASQRATQVPRPHDPEHVRPGPQPVPHAAPSTEENDGLQKALEVPQLWSRNTARHLAAPSGSNGIPKFPQFTGSSSGSLNERIAAQLAWGSATPHRR